MRTSGICWESHRRAYRRARIHWKEETRVFDLIIEAHPRHRRLDNHVHAVLRSVQYYLSSVGADLLIRMQFYNLVHKAEVDAHAAKWGREVGFEARPPRIRDCLVLAHDRLQLEPAHSLVSCICSRLLQAQKPHPWILDRRLPPVTVRC